MDMTQNGDMARYSAVARWLHWTIAALVIANLLIGLFHDPLGDAIPNIMAIHKSIGITILALTVVRIAWRVTHRPPPLPASVPMWQRGAAHASHALFYVILLVLPMTGWIFSSAGKNPLDWFGVFDIPKFALTREDPIVGAASAAHGPLGLLLLLLALLHIAAALRHHFVLKDGVLRRMLG